MHQRNPRLLVFSSLFPHKGAPNAGTFIRERMFRVGKQLPITVVSPKAWFPGQGLIRRFRPHFRPQAPSQENQQGVAVQFPRFISVPGCLKQFDGLFMALGAFRVLRRQKRESGFDILDAHFGYPDGYAAVLLGKWFDVPVTITLRGTEVPHSENTKLRTRLISALKKADRLFSVSESLRQHAIFLGVESDKIRVIGNGVDTEKFHPVERSEARRRFDIPMDAKVIVSVGALVLRKGFHRVIEILPALLERNPGLHYLIVGGSSPEGDRRVELEKQVKDLGLEKRVHFLGAMPSTDLKWPLSAADVFVLATSNEGWANVFLEAMACGLPVVTTDVGGNAEVVCNPVLGDVVPFGEPDLLENALQGALERDWNRKLIRAYAEENAWEKRVACLTQEFEALAAKSITVNHRREDMKIGSEAGGR